jgi:hypothetical protein
MDSEWPLPGFMAYIDRREHVSRDDGVDRRYVQLIPDDDRLPTVSFSRDYRFDAAFEEWLYSLPDLDAAEKARGKSSDFGLL